jgi:membrane-associated HD superfamily phosphohydrolase
MMTEKKSLAFVLNTMLSIFVTIMALSLGEIIALPILIASIIGGAVTVVTLRLTPQRATIMLAGILSGLASGIVYVVFAMINSQTWMDMLFYAGMGLASGMVASILAIGTLPMWETVFRMITPMKLLELANPNQPLLKKLLNDAPGTYHH